MSRVVHFEIQADDPQRASAFYRDVFGWEIATWDGPQTYWLARTGPGSAPGIDGGIMGRYFPQAVINTIQVESLANALSKIEQAGGKKVHGPSEVPGVGTHIYCADTEGNLFGVLQPLAGG